LSIACTLPASSVATWSRPDDLALYKATSARASNDSPAVFKSSTSRSGVMLAMPIDAVIVMLSPPPISMGFAENVADAHL
jgi:hypothetical protein